MSIIVPKEVKALKAELDLVKDQVKELREKANKYDALNERLAAGVLAAKE